MGFLDLTRHKPEDFEGKTITVNGCDYRIGPRLAAGSKRFVHQLVNIQSGLCLHVAKFLRNPETTTSDVELMLKAVYRLRNNSTIGNVIPSEIVANGHGGVFTLQDYAGPFQAKESNEGKLMREAENLEDESAWSKQIPLYENVIAANPFHTVALNNLAATQSQRGNHEAAFDAVSRALDAEPNVLTYYINYVEIAPMLGYILPALVRFWDMKTIFPEEHRYDDLGMELFLASGDPNQAKDLMDQLKEYYSDDSDDDHEEHKKRDSLSARIDSALADKSRAGELAEQAEPLIMADKLSQGLELLERANSIYDKDPLLLINLGLARYHAGEFEKAQAALVLCHS